MRIKEMPISSTTVARPLASSATGLALGLLLGLTVCTPAAAQWAWRDGSGGTVYSDQPPPPTVKQAQIIKQPSGGVNAAPARATLQDVLGVPPPAAPSTATARSPATAQSTAPSSAGANAEGGETPRSAPKTVADQEMEFRKRQAQRAEAERKQTEADNRKAQMAQECDRSRGYLRSLEEGTRIARTDADGNREFLDDNQRAAEIARTRESIGKLCGS